MPESRTFSADTPETSELIFAATSSIRSSYVPPPFTEILVSVPFKSIVKVLAPPVYEVEALLVPDSTTALSEFIASLIFSITV